MDATTYTGTNAALTVSNADNGTTGFQPDFVWFKLRSSVSRNTLFDSVRGNTKVVWSDSTDAEGTATGGTGLTSFNTNGFTLGTEIAGTSGSTNFNGSTYVAWQWKANGTAVSNTSGTITSSVSANTTAGFSIVTFTGTGANLTFGHGLSTAPAFVIMKTRNQGGAGYKWVVYHSSIGNTGALFLNGTDATSTSSGYWNNTSPTSSVVSIGTAINTSGTDTFVAYCWTPIAGFSQFGSYTGNGSADGPFVYLGFRPKFVLLKRSSAVGNWIIYDASRNTYNVANNMLFPNTADAEDTGGAIDILSNGFKARSTSASWNGSGDTYIYAAFAENPTKFANAR